jgi:hypothetical protein
VDVGRTQVGLARLVTLLVALALLLAGCGDDDEDEPTAVAPSPTAAVAATAAGPAVTGGGQATPGPVSPAASPRSSPAASPEAPSGEITVGVLADRIGSAWVAVTTYRVDEVTRPADASTTVPVPASPVATPRASPVAGPLATGVYVADEVVLPDRKRRRIVEADGTESELVAVGDVLYARGAVVRRYLDPDLPPETWVVLDPAAFGLETPLGQLLSGFLSPPGAPLSALSADERALPARPSGEATVDDRTCELYDVVRTTSTGERVVVTYGIDPTGLPCSIRTRAGGLDILTTYRAFNEPLAIEAPAGATPVAPVVASPTAAPATPTGGPTPAG